MQNLEFHNFVQFFGEGTYGVTHKHRAEKERVQNLRFSVRGGPMTQPLPLPAENVKPPDDMSNVASRVCFQAHISFTCVCLRQFSRESFKRRNTLLDVVFSRPTSLWLCRRSSPPKNWTKLWNSRFAYFPYFPPKRQNIVHIMSTGLSVHFSNIEVKLCCGMVPKCTFWDPFNIDSISSKWECRTTRSSETTVANSFLLVLVTKRNVETPF